MMKLRGTRQKRNLRSTKKHKSKKKKKKKKKEKHEKRSKSVSSVEDQENVSSETKSVWKPAFSSPPKEQAILDALSSNTESTNIVVLSSVNTQESIQSALNDKPTGLQLDVDSGFFGPKCPNELSKNVASNSVICDAEIKEQCEASAVATQQSNDSTANTSEFAKTQQSGPSPAICSQAKGPGVNSPLDVNSGLFNRSGSLSNCEILQKSKEKSRSRSKSLENVPKSLETSTTSPKSRQRSYSISRDQRKQSRSSSAGQRQRSTSRSPARRQRSRSGTSRYSKSPIRNWWSKSIRNRRRSVSVVKAPSSKTRSPARRRKSRSRSTEKRHCSRTGSRSPSRQRKSRSISRKHRQRSKSASNKRTRSKSAKRRQSKSGSVSRIRRSRSYSGSRRRKSRSGSVVRRQRSWSVAGRRRRSMSGSAARRQRSRSGSAIKRHKSRSVSPARRRRSRSASPSRRRSRSASPGKRRRSRLVSPARRRRSRSASPARRRRSRSASPARRRRSRSASPARRRRSRSASPARRRRSRSASPARRRRSRSVSPARRRRSRSASPARRRRSRSASPFRRRRSRSASPFRRRRSRSASPARRRRSRSPSPARRRRSRSPSPAKRRRSTSASPARRRRSSSVCRRSKSVERQQRMSLSSAAKRQRSRSGSEARRQSTMSTSAARKGSRSTSPTTIKPLQSKTGNKSRSRSGSVKMKGRSRSIEKTHKSRSRSSSKGRIQELAPLDRRQPSTSPTVSQTKAASSSETISDQNKPARITPEPLCNDETLCLEKTETPVKLIESSSKNAEESGSYSVSAESNQEMFDSSFKAPASNMSCSQFESIAPQKDYINKTDKEILTFTNISVEPYKPVDEASLDCTKTNYEKLQSSPDDSEVLNDHVIQSSHKISTRFAGELCDEILKPDILPVVEHESANAGSEREKACATKHKESSHVFEPTTCDQYSMDKELEFANQALHSDTSLEPESNLSYLNSANNPYSCVKALSPSPAEAVQCSDRKHFESSNYQISNDDGFKKLDSVISPSVSTVPCIDAVPEYSSTLDVQDTSTSHSGKSNIDLNLLHASVHHAALTSHIASDAEEKPNQFLATDTTSLESAFNQSEIPIKTLKGEVSDSYSQVDTNCNLKHKDESTPNFGLPSRDEVVLQNSTDTTHATLFADQSCSIVSEQTCSEETTENIAFGNTTESLSAENDFASHRQMDQNLASTYDDADLLTSEERKQSSENSVEEERKQSSENSVEEERKQSSENSVEAEMHYINKKHPEVDLTQEVTPISQSHLEELSVFPQKTQSYDIFSNSQDQADVIFQESRKSPDSHVFRSFTDGTSSSRPVLEPFEHSGLDQSIYSSSENTECEPAAAAVIYAMPSTAESGKELHEKSQNCNAISESIKIEKSCPSNNELHFNDDRNKVETLPASDDAETSTISVGFQDLKCVSNKENQNVKCEAKQKSGSSEPSKKIGPEITKSFSPGEIPSRKQQMVIQITDKLSKTIVEQTDGEISSLNEPYSILFSSNNNQNLDNIAKSATTNKNKDCKDHGPTKLLSIESKDVNKMLTERQFGLEMEADNYSQKKTPIPCTAMNATSLCVKQNSASETDDKVGTEVESNTTEPVSKLDNKVDPAVDVEAKTRSYGQIEYVPYTESPYISLNSSEVQKIATSVVPEVQKPPTAMPVQFKFSKTFKTLATSSQLCSTSDESSDKEISKVSSLSLSAKPSVSSYVESSRTNAKSRQIVVQLKQRDTPLLPEALPTESLSNVGSDGKDALQQDVIQTDESSAAVKPTFPHISNALSKLGVKQRQYRSRSVAQDSRSPSVDRRQTSRSRSKSTARKRRSRSKSVSRKKRSQSSSRKKSSHSKSAKNKRSRSKSRGRKRRSQSKSKSKKKHSPSKSSGKRKRSCSKSSERVRSVGKAESSRSKSKTRRKGAHTKSPNSRRSRSKSVGKRSRNFDLRKTSRSMSGSSRSRSRSISLSRKHLSHSKLSLHRKHSRSSSKSTSPRKRSLSRNQGHSLSRSPARRHRSRSKSHTRRHRSRSRGRWRRSLSSSRKRSRSSSRTSGTFSTKQRRRSVSKSPTRHRSRSQAKLKEKSPATKRKSISPLPQKKTIQSKAAPFKHSIGLKSLIQKQLSQAKSQGSGGKLSKEHLPLSTIAARAQLPATSFSTRAQVSAPSLNIVSQMSVPNLAEVPLPSENNGQIPLPSVLPEQQMSVTSLATEASLPVPDLTTATPWHVPDMAGGAQWPVPDIAAGTQWSMSDLTAGAQWPMADLAAGSHWPMHDLGVGTQWSVPDLAAGTPWAVPDVATGAQWTVPDLTASAQWTVPDLTAGSQWAMTNLAPGAQWTVPDLAPAAQWAVPDLTSGTHIQSADLAPEAQVPGSDVSSEAQVPGSDLATEAQVPGSDLTAEAQVPRSDLVSEAQVPVPDHVPDAFDNPVVEGHNLMPDVTAEALVPVASGTLVPDVAAGIPLPDVTVATQAPVPDVAATASIPVPDVATTAHGYMLDYVSYSAVHESVFENTAKPPVYLDMTLTAGELADSSFVTESLVSTKRLQSESFNKTENQTAFESLPSTEHCLPNELPLIHGAVPEISAVSQKEIPVSSECQLKSEYCNVSNAPLFDPRLNSEDSSLVESTAEKGSSAMSILFKSHRNSDCQLPASVTDNTSVSLHADSSPSQLHESCPSPMQSYISPNHTTLVDQYHSPDNLLIEPYSSPDRPILVTEYSKSDCQLLSEPDAVSDCSVLAVCVSSEHSPIVRATSSHDHSHQELTEHKVSLDDQQEASTAVPCPESVDYFAEPNYPEQVNTYVSPGGQISGDKSADPDIPQLVEPYGSPEHPQIVEPYASPEQPQLVEPYASPECLQLVEPYASPEHPLLVEPYGSPDSQELVESDVGQELPQVVESLVSTESAETVQSYASLQSQLIQPDDPQLDQPFANPEQTQPVQQNSSSESFTNLESSHVLQSCANLDGPQLVQPYTNSEQNLGHPFVNSKPIQLEPVANSEHPHVIQSYTIPECPEVVQSFASTDCPQLVQPYDSPEHPQLLQPCDTPEHPQLVESYGSPEHHQQDQPSKSPKHQQLVLPFDSMESSQLVQPYATPECSQLDQPYSSPKHSQPDQPHARPEHLQLDKPYASPNRSQPKQPHASPKIKQLAQPYTSPDHPQLVQAGDSQEHCQLVQPYDSPEHMQLVQPCASTEHPLLVESYASPEHSQLVEPYSSIGHPQLKETYSSPYHNQRDELNSSPALSLNLESCHDVIDENCKLAQSPLPDSRFDNPLLDKYDADTTGPSPEVPCPNLLQKPKNSPELSQPILEECCESSYKISEELYDAAPESLCGDSSECPVYMVSKEDYIDSDQYLDCSNSDSTQLDRSTSNTQLEPDQSSNHQRAIEKSLLDKRQLELEDQCARDDQQLEKQLSPVEECVISNQPQIFSEHTNSEENSSSVTCLTKDSFSTDQVLSVDLHVAGQALDEENSSSTDQLLKDTCLDLPHVAYPQVNLTLENPEQPSMPLLDRVISNAEVSLTDRTLSSLDTYVEDRAVPSVEQEERSDRLEGDKNVSTTEQSLAEENTVIFECDPPDSLTAQSDIPPSENKPRSPSQSLQEQPFISAKEMMPWNACEHPGLKVDCSKNGQILSNPEIDDLSELDETTVESSTSVMKSHPLSSQQICNLPLATVLPAVTDEPSTNLSLQTQDKVDSFVSVQASAFPVQFETHVAEDSGDNVQIDQEFKITPPDLLPFDSEQPTSLCLNSESSSEPVLFISQPPPELLPYDSEQPANPFQNISNYSSEQDSLVFHTPPELLPYDSDQATMLVSKPESCDEKRSFCEPTDVSEKSSAVFVASENPYASQGSLTSVDEETIKVQPTSSGATDTSIISTKELVCVEEYETSRSSILLQASDLPNSEMLVEQPAATFLNAESGQELPSSQSSCHETKHVLEQPFLDEITTPHPLSQTEHSVELSPLITEDSIEHSAVTQESVISEPSVSTAEIKQASLILNTCETSVVQPCSGNSELMNFSEQKKATVTQSHAVKVSNKRSRSKSLSKTELAHSLSTSTKCDSPSKHASRPARSHSRSKDRKKSRSKSKTRKKRSRSKSVTRIKKSRSKSVVKSRKSRSKSITGRKKSRSVSDTRFRRSRSRSLSRKRRSRSTSVTHKKSSRSPSAAHRRRSRSSRRKRSTSVDHKRAHSHSVARRRHSRSRSPVRRRRSRSSSLHRRKRSRSSSVARRRRSRSSSITRRRRSRSSSVSRRRHSPAQSATRRRTSPSLGRRRRSRSPSLARRRRSASHRRRSRSPSASRRRLSPSGPHRRRSRSPSSLRRKRSSSATRKRHSRSSSASRKRHSRTPTVACKRRSESKSPTPKSPKTKQRAQSKSDRSRSRSQSNIIHKRKTRSRSSSRDLSKSNEKRRKRSSSKDHYSTKQRRKSRTPPRRKKSRSPARRVSPCRSPVRRRRSRSPVRRKSFSRSPVRRNRSRSRDQSMDSARSPKRLTVLERAQLLEIAKANAAAMCVKAGMPLPASLKPASTPSAPVDEKLAHRTYGVTIQELTEKCKQIAQSKEDDEVVNKPHDSDEEEGDKPFYNHPFKVSDHKPISFSLLNPSLKPAPKTQVTLTKEFPVSSGSQHRKKESDKVYGEWVPVAKKTEESKDDVFTNTGPSQF